MSKEGYISKSNELRRLIIQRAERFNIPLSHICNHVGISYSEFLKKYANLKNVSKSNISDEKIIEIAKFVGLNVRMQIVIRDEEKFAKEVIKIKQTLKDEYINNEEKGASPQA